MEDVGGVAQHGEDDYAGQQARQKVQRGHQVGINMHSEHTQKLELKLRWISWFLILTHVGGHVHSEHTTERKLAIGRSADF